jgi:hypothetical protein
MVRSRPECAETDCTTRPSYGYKGCKPLRCSKHKLENMINVVSKRCEDKNCDRLANYGYKSITHCIQHRKEGMKNPSIKYCTWKGCNTEATFGYKSRCPLKCKKHKSPDMTDVINRRCRHPNCTKFPSFGKESNRPIYCFDHKKDDMINTNKKSCNNGECDTIPSYGYIQGNAIYCKAHMQKDMVNVIDKKCLHEDCFVKPSYGYEKYRPIYCKKHMKKDMINVISKLCAYDDCVKQASFGNKFVLYCSNHKEKGMKNIKDKKCLHENCDKRPNFGYAGESPEYCVCHKKDDMIDVVRKKCIICTEISAMKKYENMCFRCYCYTYPEKPVFRKYKLKQHFINEELKKTFPDINFIYDKGISGGCSRKRPDWFIDCLTHSIIIECDENQHLFKKYNKQCEMSRIMKLFTDLANRPLIVIRFNPDKYKDKYNFVHKSIFAYSKSGRLTIKNKNDWTLRYKSLVDKIEGSLKNPPDKDFTFIHLYFDELSQS